MNRRWGKSRVRLVSRLLFGFGLALLVAGQAVAQDSKTVYVMPVDGVVDQIMEGYIRDGIAKAEREGASAVVIQLDTPGGALDATREIVKGDPKAVVVICSALGQESLVMEAIEAGAADFIVKPFRAEDVLAVVKKVLGETPKV